MADGFGPWTSEFVVKGQVSEDCLFLNVWAPAASSDTPRPVLVWIHGGGFCQGSGSVPIYDGCSLAARDLVVVTINYRLGLLGFLAHPDLTQESPGGSGGNFGLQDQLAALRWVQTNIAAFGGDPGAVTIAGQSAGALSVQMLVATASARGLFHRAIALSGPPTLMPIQTKVQAEAEGVAFTSSLGQSTVQAMRDLPIDVLTCGLGPEPRFMPMIDGVLLPDWPPHPSMASADSTVPMLIGLTSDEGSGLDPNHDNGDPAALQALLSRLHRDQAIWMAAAYLEAAGGQGPAAYRSASLDLWLAAQWCWAGERVQASELPVFAYLFDHAPPGPHAQRYGAFHTADVPYVLGTLDASPQREYRDEDRQLSALATAYVVNFVASGDPNQSGLPHWPALTPAAPRMLRLSAKPAPSAMLSSMALKAARLQMASTTPVTLFD